MAPTVRRSQLDSDIFPNYLGVVLSYYYPTFLAGHSNAEIHDFLKWGSVILDTNCHNCFFGLVGHSTYAQRPKKPPNPFLMVATGIAYTVIVLTS